MDEQDTAATSKALMSWWGKDDGLLDKAQVLQEPQRRAVGTGGRDKVTSVRISTTTRIRKQYI